MKRMLKQLMGALCVLLLATQAWAGGGGYSSTAVGPTLYNKSYSWSTASFPPVGPIPAGSKIGAWVNYTWSASYVPTGLQTYLCYNSSLLQCVPLYSQSGSTTAFNGMAAGNTFVLAQRVPGSGALYPAMYGNMDQVIVNFTY